MRKTEDKISKSEWVRLWIIVLKKHGICFFLTFLSIAICIASAVAPFIVLFVKEQKPTPYDELYEATGIGSSVTSISSYRGSTSLYQLTMEDGEEFFIQYRYFRDYLHDHSERTLEKRLKKLLLSEAEIHVKYDIVKFTSRKFVRELYVGDTEVVAYQSKSGDPPRFVLFMISLVAAIPLFLLFFVISMLTVGDCKDMVRDELRALRARE